LALHEPLAVPPLAWPSHAASQFPEHVPVQLALQSYDPGFAVQSPEHFALQEPVQLASAFTLHLASQSTSSFPSQAALKLTVSHFAVQPPFTSTLHCALALTLMFPHASIPA
jgi:hypothetical protein